MQEGEVVRGLAVASDGDPAFALQPRVRPLDGPAVTSLGVERPLCSPSSPPDLPALRPGRDRISCPTPLGDVWSDTPLAQGLSQISGVIASVSPQLARMDAARLERIDERQEMAALVLVTGGQPDRKRQAASVYSEVKTASRLAQECAADLLAPFLASTSEASTITRDQSILPAS